MRTLPAAVIARKNAEQSEPVLLFELDVEDPPNPATRLNFTEDTQNVIFNSKTYTAFEVTHDNITTTNDETVEQFNITFENQQLLLSTTIEANDGLRGRLFTCKRVWRDLLTDVTAVTILFQGKVKACSVNQNVVTLMVSSDVDTLENNIPRRLFSRPRCQAEFGATAVSQAEIDAGTPKASCGWANFTASLNPSFPAASASICDKGLDTPNGCIAHNNKRRFNAYPGVGAGTVYIASGV